MLISGSKKRKKVKILRQNSDDKGGEFNGDGGRNFRE